VLEVHDISASYRGLRALQSVSIAIEEGEIVAVVGANGAGKSTLLKAIAGFVPLDSGSVTFRGATISNLPAHRVTTQGVSLVPEGRRLFPGLSVRDNLRLGAYAWRKQQNANEPLDRIFALFPRLAERLDQAAGTLSGGEQQMLAIGRALMTRPQLLMLDEPSQGIMPKLVDDILDAVQRIRDQGMTVLIVEQRLAECLAIADRAYVLQTGQVALTGPAADIAKDTGVRAAYLGL
jgi:branched-chain amino acid transport system ATP-binding protein